MSAEPICGADIVIKALVDQGVDVVFGYPGGAVLPIYDSLFKQNALRHILVRQEGGAVHAAEGYARSTGKVGVVLVTSGPGATNAVTGLTDALMDSVPIVCLTGQVPTHLIGNDAFQEADTTGITRPCTKHNYLVKDVADLARVMHEAFYVARSGRPGPVVVDLPKDILFALGDIHRRPEQARHKSYRPQTAARPGADRRGGGADRGGEAAAVLWRRRADQFRPRGLRPVYRIRAAGRCAVHADPDGARRVAGERPAFPRHGRHARHVRVEHGDARLRSDDRGRLALRRPGDRAAQRLLAEFEEDPHRHRPVLDQQERADRRAAARRLRRGAGGAARGLAQGGAAAADGAARNAWWRQIDAWRARDCLRYDRSRQGHHQAAIRAGAALRADPGPRPVHHDRGRPAPDVGGAVLQVRQALPLDDLGRARHDGLWAAGRGRGAGRAPGRARHRRRRRSLDPDEHPGDVDDLRSTGCR